MDIGLNNDALLSSSCFVCEVQRKYLIDSQRDR